MFKSPLFWEVVVGVWGFVIEGWLIHPLEALLAQCLCFAWWFRVLCFGGVMLFCVGCGFPSLFWVGVGLLNVIHSSLGSNHFKCKSPVALLERQLVPFLLVAEHVFWTGMQESREEKLLL